MCVSHAQCMELRGLLLANWQSVLRPSPHLQTCSVEVQVGVTYSCKAVLWSRHSVGVKSLGTRAGLSHCIRE